MSSALEDLQTNVMTVMQKHQNHLRPFSTTEMQIKRALRIKHQSANEIVRKELIESKLQVGMMKSNLRMQN